MGRPRSSFDVALAIHLIGKGRTDAAAAREVGLSRWGLRKFRRRLVMGARRPGRPRSADPVTLPHWSRAPLAA